METLTLLTELSSQSIFIVKGLEGVGSSNQILCALDKKQFMGTHEHRDGLSET